MVRFGLFGEKRPIPYSSFIWNTLQSSVTILYYIEYLWHIKCYFVAFISMKNVLISVFVTPIEP